MSSDNIGLRAAIGAVCFVGGFFFWPLFIPAAIMAMTLTATSEEQHEAQRPKPKSASVERAGIRIEDADWKDRFLEACESPAESAFLTAMIESFSLKPINGVLKAPGLTLNMQVDMQRYRLDFLANEWLIIEIDGAAWHSSQQAVARDRIRDEFFDSYDYTVLRISAKTVFNTPQEAVRLVRTALAKGRKVSRQKLDVPQKPASVMGAIGGFALGAGKFVGELNAYIDRASALQEAMTKPQSIFDAEKQAIKIAMEIAEHEIKVENYRNQSPEHARRFDEAYALIGGRVNEEKDGGDPGREAFKLMQEKISPIQKPQPHPKEEINEAIDRQFTSMMEERAEFFEGIRDELKADERRSMLIKTKLLEMGCMTCWQEIAPRKM